MRDIEDAIALFDTDRVRGLQEVQSLHAKHPARVDVLYALGECYWALGQRSDAERAWKRALHFNPADQLSLKALERLNRKPEPNSSDPTAATPKSMTEMGLPSTPEEWEEYERRREAKEQVDNIAALRAKAPEDLMSRRALLDLMTEEQRLKRKSRWRALHPGMKVLTVVSSVFAAVIFAIMLYTFAVAILPRLLGS